MADHLHLDPSLSKALLDLMAFEKPFHDHYFAFAVAADAKEMKKFKRYIRKRSHQKGEDWKSILFLLNDFIDITEIPATPAFPVDVNMDVADILAQMLDEESQCRQAVETVMALARAKNENRILNFLNGIVKDLTHHETKILRLSTLWDELGGDVYEFQKFV